MKVDRSTRRSDLVKAIRDSTSEQNVEILKRLGVLDEDGKLRPSYVEGSGSEESGS